MSQLDDLIKSIKKGNYEKALSKKKSANVIAKEAKSDIEKKTDKLKEKRTYVEEVQKAKPETGTEATDRLLDAIKTARGKVISGDKPIHSQDFPKDKGYEEWMTTGMRVNPTKTGYKEYLGTPKSDTVSEIGLGRVKELKDELQTAKFAKDEDIPFKEAQQSAPVRKAYKSKMDELVKMFNQPGVDPRKVRYLIKLQSQEWLKRNYPAYSDK